jgi:hypothetical protein
METVYKIIVSDDVAVIDNDGGFTEFKTLSEALEFIDQTEADS